MVIVYDIGIERIDAVRHVLKKYLQWIQNSAFEGNITLGKLEELKILVRQLIDEKYDSIMIYSINNSSWISKEILGKEKGKTENII